MLFKSKDPVSTGFTKEFDDDSAFYITVETNGLKISCQIIDPENIIYPQFLDYLKDVSNNNNFVRIRLDETELFKDLFGELGWQYDVCLDENLSNGVETTIRVMDDSNIYALEYWNPIPYLRRLLAEAEASIQG